MNIISMPKILIIKITELINNNLIIPIFLLISFYWYKHKCVA